MGIAPLGLSVILKTPELEVASGVASTRLLVAGFRSSTLTRYPRSCLCSMRRTDCSSSDSPRRR